MASIVVTSALLVGSPPVVTAQGSSQTDQLCTGAPACSVKADSWIREGSTPVVTVRGNPNVRGTVRIFRAQITDNRLSRLEPISEDGEFFTNGDGAATVRAPVNTSSRIGTGGWALVTLSDIQGLDATRMVGEFVPFGSQTPMLLGDGWSERKPAGQTLDMHAVGAVPGTHYRIQVNDGSTWQDVTAVGTDPVAPEDPAEVTHLVWTVPRGLPATTHQVRAQSVNDPVRTVTWTLIPSVDGVSRARTPLFKPPNVGTNLGVPTSFHGDRPTGLVKGTSAGVAAFSGVAAAVAVVSARPFGARRRRREEAE